MSCIQVVFPCLKKSNSDFNLTIIPVKLDEVEVEVEVEVDVVVM
jgi:hypothetical protein